MPTLSQVIGLNVRRIRSAAGVTQDALAVACVRVGLAWTAIRVAQCERGDTSPNLATLLLLTAALDTVTPARQRVTLADLVASDGSVSLAPGVVAPTATIAAVIRGGGGTALADYSPPFTTAGGSAAELTAAEGWTRADAKVAAELGLPRDIVTKVAARLWGRSLSAERDARADNARTKGLVTKELTAALREEWAREAADG